MIENKYARALLMVIVLGLGFANLYWLNTILAIGYLTTSILMLAYLEVKKNKTVLVISRFWILVLPFLGVLNGPSKLGWFLAFLAASWLASKNAFEKRK